LRVIQTILNLHQFLNESISKPAQMMKAADALAFQAALSLKTKIEAPLARTIPAFVNATTMAAGMERMA
jgi:hypothetical protein